MKLGKNPINDMGKLCPDCKSKLHIGQERFKDGLFLVEYCKNCGFRLEKPFKR